MSSTFVLIAPSAQIYEKIILPSGPFSFHPKIVEKPIYILDNFITQKDNFMAFALRRFIIITTTTSLTQALPW